MSNTATPKARRQALAGPSMNHARRATVGLSCREARAAGAASLSTRSWPHPALTLALSQQLYSPQNRFFFSAEASLHIKQIGIFKRPDHAQQTPETGSALPLCTFFRARMCRTYRQGERQEAPRQGGHGRQFAFNGQTAHPGPGILCYTGVFFFGAFFVITLPRCTDRCPIPVHRI